MHKRVKTYTIFFLSKQLFKKIKKKIKKIMLKKKINIDQKHDFPSYPFIIISLYIQVLVSKSCYTSISQHDAQVATWNGKINTNQQTAKSVQVGGRCTFTLP